MEYLIEGSGMGMVVRMCIEDAAVYLYFIKILSMPGE